MTTQPTAKRSTRTTSKRQTRHAMWLGTALLIIGILNSNICQTSCSLCRALFRPPLFGSIQIYLLALKNLSRFGNCLKPKMRLSDLR